MIIKCSVCNIPIGEASHPSDALYTCDSCVPSVSLTEAERIADKAKRCIDGCTVVYEHLKQRTWQRNEELKIAGTQLTTAQLSQLIQSTNQIRDILLSGTPTVAIAMLQQMKVSMPIYADIGDEGVEMLCALLANL